MVTDPYPLGEPFRTVGFDIRRMPKAVPGHPLPVVAYDESDYPENGYWFASGELMIGNEYYNAEYAYHLPKQFHTLYIVPPLTTK